MVDVVQSLQRQIASCEATLSDLRRQLTEAEQVQRQRAQASQQHKPQLWDPLEHDMNYGITDHFRSEVFAALGHGEQGAEEEPQRVKGTWPLDKNEYKRYGRQLIMPEVGLAGQLRLRDARVLIVGVGGLGCPAATYLVGAGVGTVGLIDDDVVEESNLHRQILHSTSRIGMTKVQSAMVTLSSLNPNVKLVPHVLRLSPGTAISLFEQYDLILDCTDTPASRYLISDACILLGKTLVSASALRIDGQLMVLNNPPLPPGDITGGPCYRCVFPKPPPPESVVSCGDGGILGPVVGVMGTLQALEAIKIITQKTHQPRSSDPPSLLIFSAYSTPMFRSIRLRSRKPKCAACSAQATVTPEILHSGSLDYVQFCGSIKPIDALTPQERVSAENFAKLISGVNPYTGTVSNRSNHILVDVREKVQFELCHIDGSINVPFSTISATPAPELHSPRPALHDMEVDKIDWVTELRQSEKPIFVICRLGNDSQITVKKMKELGLSSGGRRFIGDIRGGLLAWRQSVDPDFPDY